MPLTTEVFLAQTGSLDCERDNGWGLFARRAGVHIDFHADRYFNDLWGLPGHCWSPYPFADGNSLVLINIKANTEFGFPVT
jgi:hypothetical protein